MDTYNVIKSGIPNAIKVFNEVVIPRGYRPAGIRIDSGDIAYLSKKARKMLDEAGLTDCKIVASNSLDEYIIRDLITQGAKVDSFGVGENLITSKSDPVFGGVYKLVAIQEGEHYIPKIKISETVEKITNPGFKQVWRFFDKDTHQAIADYVTEFGEEVDTSKPITIFDPNATWKKQTLENVYAVPVLEQVFAEGRSLYTPLSLQQLQNYCLEQVDHLWEEVKRFENPHRYYVDLSPSLWRMKRDLLEKVNTF